MSSQNNYFCTRYPIEKLDKKTNHTALKLHVILQLHNLRKYKYYVIFDHFNSFDEINCEGAYLEYTDWLNFTLINQIHQSSLHMVHMQNYNHEIYFPQKFLHNIIVTETHDYVRKYRAGIWDTSLLSISLCPNISHV